MNRRQFLQNVIAFISIVPLKGLVKPKEIKPLCLDNFKRAENALGGTRTVIDTNSNVRFSGLVMNWPPDPSRVNIYYNGELIEEEWAGPSEISQIWSME